MTEPSWTWERLRDFFAGGGKISLPSNEDFMRDLTPPRISLDDALRLQEEALRKKFWDEMPKDFGVDLATFGSEAWLMRFDWETGKIVYRKLDPADMVRPDEGEEGIPDEH